MKPPNSLWMPLVFLSLIILGVILITQTKNTHNELQDFVKQMAVASAARKEGSVRSSANKELNALRENGVSINLADYNIDDMTDLQILLTIHSLLDNTDTVCTRKLRMGDMDDGGWEICDDPDVAPEPPCIIYSFGINNDWSFDDVSSEIYRCHVYSFDPSIKQETYNRSERVHFHKVGIFGKTEVNDRNWQLYTFNDLKRYLGHQDATVDIIKMDVESSEWPTLENMISTGAFDGVKQLLIEFHVTHTDREYLLPRLKSIQALERMGFKKFYVSKNYHCQMHVEGFPIKRTKCYEVHYLRRS